MHLSNLSRAKYILALNATGQEHNFLSLLEALPLPHVRLSSPPKRKKERKKMVRKGIKSEEISDFIRILMVP